MAKQAFRDTGQQAKYESLVEALASDMDPTIIARRAAALMRYRVTQDEIFAALSSEKLQSRLRKALNAASAPASSRSR